MYGPDTGETYAGLSCCNNEELAERCLVPNAPKVIWAINNQTAKFNSDCAIQLWKVFMQGKIRLLVSEFSTDDELNKLKGYSTLALEDKLKFVSPCKPEYEYEPEYEKYEP